MIRFYAPNIETDSTLPEVESGHCCRVLRMRTGDQIEVVDGRGGLYKCLISEANPKTTGLDILSKSELFLNWKPKITLAVAPTKNMDRMEWLAEKAVEIGINRLVFLNCHNSVRKTMKSERIEKIMVSAMKQSLKAILPELVELVPYHEFIRNDNSSCKFVGYCDDRIERKEFAVSYDGQSDITIMIGPEGDFTNEEIRAAFDEGYVAVTFGNTRLRTETAALYALCSAHTIITQH